MINTLAAAARRSVSRETEEKIAAFVGLLRAEAQRQNLISAATVDQLWERHVLDSAQLVRFESHAGASWVDVGSGAGLPGIVIACMVQGSCTLIEPRRLRADFLHRVVELLRLDARIVCSRAEKVTGTFDLITARAVAPLCKVLELSYHLSTRKTRWVLPKGQRAAAELEDALRTWQGAFHVEPSVTDDRSWIVVGAGVRAKRS